VVGTAGVATGLTTAPLAVLPPTLVDKGADASAGAVDADAAVGADPAPATVSDAEADAAPALAEEFGAGAIDAPAGCRNSEST
jgi:hypothetical protein